MYTTCTGASEPFVRAPTAALSVRRIQPPPRGVKPWGRVVRLTDGRHRRLLPLSVATHGHERLVG